MDKDGSEKKPQMGTYLSTNILFLLYEEYAGFIFFFDRSYFYFYFWKVVSFIKTQILDLDLAGSIFDADRGYDGEDNYTC
jgi:hypothetical protein